jgi:hypothetical protein
MAPPEVDAAVEQVLLREGGEKETGVNFFDLFANRRCECGRGGVRLT